ncbi:MAG: N-acetylneuraminate synthase [Proteobacteria bacterium]|nr:N-acetylneuraminate synthase [Pseudomonadota bacterium]MBU1389484.1 N-acetylneuraminate synthase [Pseudomonadota bacterium]MBU1541304.1 N-acetylneuraminate synthase [Pseudomonadota bacterium]
MPNKKTIIIAEAGVNHNGNLETAKKLIDAASDAKADFVKFQTFNADTLVTLSAGKAEYQKKLTGSDESQYQMLKKLELDRNAHYELVRHCQKRGVGFLSTAFDVQSIDFLAELDLKYFKVPSGEITNLPYLRHIGKQGKRVLLSTGMATLMEIKDALTILMDSGISKRKVTVLHCNTEYPTPMSDVNLKAMLTIQEKLDVQVGYSDHTLGIEIPIAAVALGATVVEKHLTLDRKMVGPDHHSSLEPDEFKSMVTAIRNVTQALGDGIKKPSLSEFKNIAVARKSIVASRTIKKGEIFTNSNLTVKRPGTGMSPMLYDQMLGKVSNRTYYADEMIESING